jgi:hypothetical protein
VKWPLASLALFALIGTVGAAQAESCTKSRDMILTAASDLPQKPKIYQDLLRDCLDTMTLPNVQDAFILKVGAIGVLPRRDSVSATAVTLAQFCGRFPHGSLHFVGQKERARLANIARAVEWSSPRSTSCDRIRGGG